MLEGKNNFSFEFNSMRLLEGTSWNKMLSIFTKQFINLMNGEYKNKKITKMKK